MKNFKVKVKMIIVDDMDIEAKNKDDAILSVKDVLENTKHKNLMSIFTSKPNFIFDVEEIDEECN